MRNKICFVNCVQTLTYEYIGDYTTGKQAPRLYPGKKSTRKVAKIGVPDRSADDIIKEFFISAV